MKGTYKIAGNLCNIILSIATFTGVEEEVPTKFADTPYGTGWSFLMDRKHNPLDNSLLYQYTCSS